VSGKIRWNGHPSSAAAGCHRDIGYVSIADDHVPELTVAETLRFSNVLRFPRRLAPALVSLLVGATLRALGLTNVANSLVGGAEIRGLSGGERRRLSLGAELVNLPSLLFAQHPTDGLDSASAVATVKYCKALMRASHRAVLMSLVQPSPSLLLEFDSVMLMAKGTVLYAGAPAQLLAHLFRLGYRLPEHKCWTELVEEVSAQPDLFFAPGTPLPPLTTLGGLVIRRADIRPFETTQSQKKKTPSLRLASAHKVEEAEANALETCRDIWLFAAEMWHSSLENAATLAAIESIEIDFVAAQKSTKANAAESEDANANNEYRRRDHARDRVPFCTQLYWLLDRQARLMSRSTGTLLVARILPALVFALILGSLFFQLGVAQVDARTRVGALFFCVLQPVFETFPMVASVFAQRPIFYAQRQSAYFDSSAYSLSNFIADAALMLVVRLAFSLLVYPMIGLAGGVASAQFVAFWLIGTLVSIASRAWMALIASTIALEPVAGLSAPISIVGLLLFCGFVIPRINIPIGLQWLHRASFLTFGFRGLVLNEFAALPLRCAPDELVPSAANALLALAPPLGFGGVRVCPYTSGAQFVAAAFDIDPSAAAAAESAWSNIGALFGFAVLFVAAATAVQRYMDHSKNTAVPAPTFRDLAMHAASASSSGMVASSEEAVSFPPPSEDSSDRIDILASSAHAEPPHEVPVRLAFRDLSYTVPIPATTAGGQATRKTLLHGISGAALPGARVASAHALDPCVCFSVYVSYLSFSIDHWHFSLFPFVSRYHGGTDGRIRRRQEHAAGCARGSQGLLGSAVLVVLFLLLVARRWRGDRPRRGTDHHGQCADQRAPDRRLLLAVFGLCRAV
jgi:ATP-binding cassette subfamily G (WHITE) protein 2 (SNQ2)